MKFTPSEQLSIEGMTYYKSSSTRGNKEVFYDKYRNNLIVFDPHENSVAEMVMRFTNNVARRHLLKKLKCSKNTIVYWAQPNDFTLSEYIVFRGFDIERLKRKSHADIIDILSDSIQSTDNSFESRYRYVLDGVLRPYIIKNERKELIV
ncbi:hypothetical protein [Metabacillus litoralis]|uniref:hypothetical protein n=1 Tax=Metabacillus litoralis TaxID=152268 RepID=UPI00203A439B|nr:hypothetical protein [Metabacillus litoralis]MCM3411869.1 hypothetical protein [Metabacillus litoralis]